MDLTKPLPFERTQPATPQAIATAAQEAGALTPQDAAVFTRPTVSENDVAVDQVAPMDPDVLTIAASLGLQDGEEHEFGESNDPTRSLAAIQEEAVTGTLRDASSAAAPIGAETTEEQPATPGPGVAPEPAAAPAGVETASGQAQESEVGAQLAAAQQEPEACPKEKGGEPTAIPEDQKMVGPLTVRERAGYLMEQMWKGIKNWFECNWHWLLLGAVGALAGIILLSMLTGGAIWTALPVIMEIVGAFMIGVTLGRVAVYVGEYLTKGWDKDTDGAAKSLARGLAIGAVELASWLAFKVLGAIMKVARNALRATLRGAATAGRALGAAGRAVGGRVGRTAAGRAVRAMGGAAIRRGRIVLQGLRSGFGRGVRSLDDLAERLFQRVRFRRFKLRIQGPRIQLLGYINPWVVIMEGPLAGQLVEVSDEAVAGLKAGDITTVPTKAGPFKGIVEPFEPAGRAAPRPGVLSGDPGEIAGKLQGRQRQGPIRIDPDGKVRVLLEPGKVPDPHTEAELLAADALTNRGVNVHFRTPQQTKQTSDFFVGGEPGTGSGGRVFEVVQPETSTLEGLAKRIRGKLEQAEGNLIIDLNHPKTDLTPEDVSNVVSAMRKNPQITRPIKEVIVIVGPRIVRRL